MPIADMGRVDRNIPGSELAPPCTNPEMYLQKQPPAEGVVSVMNSLTQHPFEVSRATALPPAAALRGRV